MTPHHHVAIVGAGISGIAAAIKLREAGIEDVVLLESAATYGGTWRANTYPGCACDVPSGLYSFSFAPTGNWSRLYGTQPEILAYINEVARGHGLEQITRFGVTVTSADWREDRWHLETSSGPLTATFAIAAAGPWNEPLYPEIPGLDSFEGPVFHSARWDHEVDLAGKRVATVGSGASAVQFVPELQREVAALHVFQRTAHWVLPKPDVPVPPRMRRWLSKSPRVLGALRRVEYGVMETLGLAFHRPRPLMHVVQGIGRAYLRVAVPDAALRKTLTPQYLIGCKRILFSNTYLRALTRENVQVHATAVAEVRGSTVVGADGTTAEVDAIVLGTGFRILDMPLAGIVRGADGRSLAEHWAGSPEAFQGTMVAGFPNAFVVLGPSLGTGHSSAMMIAEAQVAFIVDAIGRAGAEGWSTIEVRPEAQAEYVAEVQRALGSTAYNASACHSYYVDENGRNSFVWPWSTSALVRRVSQFEPSAFTVTRAEQPAAPAA